MFSVGSKSSSNFSTPWPLFIIIDVFLLLARQEMVKTHDKKNADREKIIIFPGRKEEKFQSELGKPNCLVQLSPIKVFCVYVKNLLFFFFSSCPKICMYTLCVYKILMM